MNSADRIATAIDQACAAIAPSWPLDRFIAVNPWWGWVDQPIEQVDAKLARIAGTRLVMSNAWFRDAWRDGRIGRADLQQALTFRGSTRSVDELVAALDAPAATPAPLPLPSDSVDARRDLACAPSWADTITHQVSQHCAAWFDREQADWHLDADAGLYASWCRALAGDRGIGRLMGNTKVAPRAATLPADARAAIAHALAALDVPTDLETDFLRAVLLRINGWAAWCAYERWQARLAGGDDAHIVELLAIRLGWEVLLDDGNRHAGSDWSRWQQALLAATRAAPSPSQVDAWIWQHALELSWQAKVAAAIAGNRPQPSATPSVQAVFCIDVRSEVFRRALERAAPSIETMGFAGFFGLPIQYTPLGTTATRPQLPGLLVPAVDVTETSGTAAHDEAVANARRAALARKSGWSPFKRMPASGFTLVETVGIGDLVRLIGRSVVRGGDAAAIDRTGLGRADAEIARPQLVLADRVAQGADIARKVLHALGLEQGYARLVLLAGHGSRSANNPHAAGLDCGACCGQTGEVNARALANLLNDAGVRAALAQRGLDIPVTTHFLAGMHDTTIDEVQLFDRDLVPASHAADLSALEAALAAAGTAARRERAPALGLGALVDRPDALHAAVRARASDWAQTRPEWGLADNAGFIVAPRRRTRGIDLAGKTFLHDYDHRKDADGSVLELIMTAPMVVTHWINMQYHASTVEPRRYGAGNKVLHNVVGARIGVFEGNGGDLRIGLPWQSVHDGERFLHTPRRLSVFIAAPQAMIDAVIERHAVVRNLVDGGWLHLFRIDPDSSVIAARRHGDWVPFADPPRVAAAA
jgi:uncharacterized protein YbcC (UPF0753/DUF2309 family)